MDGRTYHIWRTESYDVYSYGEDGKVYGPAREPAVYDVREDLVVPNGTWVMKRTLGFGYSWLIGADTDEVDYVNLDTRSGSSPTLHFSKKPFGYVWSEEAEYLEGTNTLVPKGPRLLFYAEQIRKGELYQGVPVPKLNLAREHESLARKYHDFLRNRDQKRNPFCWARLDEVVAASGLSAYDLLKGYWPFVGVSHTYDHANQRGGELLHVRYGDTRDEIESQTHPHSYLNFEELDNLVKAGNLDFIWIRAGFAKTLLRLHALGYEPTRVASTTT